MLPDLYTFAVWLTTPAGGPPPVALMLAPLLPFISTRIFR